jgi:hypothetical protein
MRTVLLAAALAGLAQAQSSGAIDFGRPERVVPLQSETNHVQGIDTDGRHLWVTSVDTPTRKGYLRRFGVADGRLEAEIEVQDGERFHPGGIQADGDSVWMPVAEYRASSTSVIQRRNRTTLQLEFQFSVPDHIGCIAVTPEYIIGGNWDSRDFYFWDRRGTLIRKVTSETMNAYQDLKFHANQVVASGTMAGRKGAVDWLEFPSLRLVRRETVGNTDRGDALTREGMALVNNEIWFLPEDGASRLFIFAAPYLLR